MHMMKKHGWWIITLAIIGAFVALLVVQANRPGKYDQFAQCINDSGAEFYGAWWCPHCQNQKAIFGRSSRYLPYTECETKTREEFQACIDAEINKTYPTWIFADGTRSRGEQTLAMLAEKTSCELPVLE